MSKSKTNSKINFLSFVVLAGDDSNDEVTRKHAIISQIARRSSSHFEVIFLRSPRKDLSSSKSESLRRELSNCIFIEQSSRVSRNASAVIGLRQAIGDWIVVLDRSENQLEAMANLVESIDSDHEVVFGRANAKRAARQSISYRVGQKVFGWAFTAIHGSNFSSEAPVFRAMSRSAFNLVLAARRPDVEFRAFITSAALPAKTISFQANSKENKTPFWQSFGSAMEMLLGGTKVPMRFASLVSLFGAVLNIFYAIYVLVTAVLGDNIQDGWASTSLQLSAMFFLVCLVLFLISEYLLQLMPDREHSTTQFSSSFDGDPIELDKHLNVEKLKGEERQI